MRKRWVTLLTSEQLRIMDRTEGRQNNVYALAELPNVKFLIGQNKLTPLYTYVNIRGGVMTINGNPVGLHSMAQTRVKSVLAESLEADAATWLDFRVVGSPNPPTEYSRLIGSYR